MATTVLNNITVLVNGTNLSGVCNEAAINFSAEMIDQTTFGNTTRIRRGGLTAMTVNLKGFMNDGPTAAVGGSTGGESALYPVVGSSGTIITIFPTTIDTCSPCGFATRGVVESFIPGGAVGAILPFTAVLQSAGLEG